MKRKITLPILTLLALNLITTNSTAQCVQSGAAIVDVYYGGPNVIRYYAKSAAQSSETEMNVTGKGPFGIRGEYFLTDHIALGCDINYVSVAASWKEQVSNPTPINYYYKVTYTRIRALSKLNFHFGTSAQFDWHAGFGFGYNQAKIRAFSNDPNFDAQDMGSFFSFPICARIDIGGKYFFTENIGVGFDMGLGGPLASAALLIKFDSPAKTSNSRN